jgi:glycerol-3-phosphate acyltransferase PlsX
VGSASIAEPLPRSLRERRVVLDAMGGDDAPGATVAGALAAAGDGVDVVLVGDTAQLQGELERVGAGGALEIVHADAVIGMEDDPVPALRAKPTASIRVACELVAEGTAGAIVSAGSTGATLAAALLSIGRLPGVRRPVVAAVLPLRNGGHAVLADAGGSMDVHPEALPGYAAMAGAYAEVLGRSEPRIGLLNVGEEPGKGNALAKEAFSLLSQRSGFVGNVEPGDVLDGAVDVVVTDGFTGNIFLKTIEATGAATAGEHDTTAVLLGVAGEVLVAHGAANADDVRRALRRAAQVAAGGLAAEVGRRLAPGEDRQDRER